MKIKRTAEQWQVIFEEQQQSGMTIEAFCQQKDIPITTFYNKTTWTPTSNDNVDTHL